MRRFSLTTVLMLGALTAFLTGCSRNPVAAISAPMDGSAQPMVGIQTDDDPSDVDGSARRMVTAQVLPSEDGQLQVGRFTLDLHKNTLKMPATITMQVLSEDAMEVQITVTPAEANDFQVPAQLTADMTDKPEADFQNFGMFYWEDWGWEQTPAGREHHNTLVAHMQHLSACRVAEEANTSDAAKQR